jgi:hypothetical protein
VEQAHCINAFISFEGEDSLIRRLLAHLFRMLLIFFLFDIDEMNIILGVLTQYRPRVMIVEFNLYPKRWFLSAPRYEGFSRSSLRALRSYAKDHQCRK